MCVIIVKPAGKRIPADLLEATASLNRDGWGLMGLRDNGELVVKRQPRVRPGDIARALTGLDDATVALHLRLRTAGSTTEADVHPFKVTDDLYLMHNGTLDIQRREPGRSDTWHLVNDVLQPLAERFEGLLGDDAFAALLEASLGPDTSRPSAPAASPARHQWPARGAVRGALAVDHALGGPPPAVAGCARAADAQLHRRRVAVDLNH